MNKACGFFMVLGGNQTKGHPILQLSLADYARTTPSLQVKVVRLPSRGSEPSLRWPAALKSVPVSFTLGRGIGRRSLGLFGTGQACQDKAKYDLIPQPKITSCSWQDGKTRYQDCWRRRGRVTDIMNLAYFRAFARSFVC